MSEIKLLTGPNAPNVKTFKVHVPAGHVLPGGHAVKDPFDVTVVAGARWLPEWDAPRYHVAAYRFLPLGDAVGFMGDRAKAFPLPEWVMALADWHGHKVLTPGAALVAGGLFAPFKRESVSDLAVIPASRLN